jgi:hypothetical protein
MSFFCSLNFRISLIARKSFPAIKTRHLNFKIFSANRATESTRQLLSIIISRFNPIPLFSRPYLFNSINFTSPKLAVQAALETTREMNGLLKNLPESAPVLKREP